MNQRHAASAYRESSVENAPPIKIVRMLYQGALRFLDRAEADSVSPSDPQFIYLLARAEAIVTELRVSLDPTHAPELVENLQQLYLFVEERLRKAGMESSKAPLKDVRTVLTNLLDAWQRVEVVSR
jgi:flagellar protein FliS